MLGLGIRKAIKARLSRLLDEEEGTTETRAYAAPAPVPAPVAAAPVARNDGPVAQPMHLPPAKKVEAKAEPKVEAKPAPVAAPVEVKVAAPVAEPAADDIVGRPFTPDAVQAVLDDMVRPALQADGGDISLVRLEDQSVYVRLVGSCSSCPSSIATMKMGVERLLMEEFPEMRALVQVD